MYKYRIDFSKYSLRSYEKYIALKEFESQFPDVKSKIADNDGIEFTTRNLLAWIFTAPNCADNFLVLTGFSQGAGSAFPDGESAGSATRGGPKNVMT